MLLGNKELTVRIRSYLTEASWLWPLVEDTQYEVSVAVVCVNVSWGACHAELGWICFYKRPRVLSQELPLALDEFCSPQGTTGSPCLRAVLTILQMSRNTTQGTTSEAFLLLEGGSGYKEGSVELAGKAFYSADSWQQQTMVCVYVSVLYSWSINAVVSDCLQPHGL